MKNMAAPPLYGRSETRTCDNFICMLAKTCKKPTTASHSLLWARLCWFPMHGPWRAQRTTQRVQREPEMIAHRQRGASRGHTVPVCTPLESWRPAWPLPELWRSSFDLPRLWCPYQSSTSRNHLWIPRGRKNTVKNGNPPVLLFARCDPVPEV